MIGPWEIGSEIGATRTEVLARPESGPAQVVAVVTTRKEVGVLKDDKQIVDCPQGQAALRLIVAAPQLLAGAERMLANIERWLETGIASDPDESRSIYEQLRSAVEAATGAAPRPLTKEEEAAEVHKR